MAKISVKMTAREAKALCEKAYEAANAALAACVPVPMIVGEAKSLFSSELDTSKQMHYVEGGVCGFAWVEIRPARGSFVTYLKNEGIGRKSDYYRCWMISASSVGGQSMQRKEAWARAYAEVLRDAGIEAYMMSRLD